MAWEMEIASFKSFSGIKVGESCIGLHVGRPSIWSCFITYMS